MKKIIVMVVLTTVAVVPITMFLLKTSDIKIYDLTFWYTMFFFLLSFIGLKGKNLNSFSNIGRQDVGNYVHINANIEQERRNRIVNTNSFIASRTMVIYPLIMAIIFLIVTIYLSLK